MQHVPGKGYAKSVKQMDSYAGLGFRSSHSDNQGEAFGLDSRDSGGLGFEACGLGLEHAWTGCDRRREYGIALTTTTQSQKNTKGNLQKSTIW